MHDRQLAGLALWIMGEECRVGTKTIRLLFIDYSHGFNYMHFRISSGTDAAWEACLGRAGECGARGRACNPRSGGFGYQPLGTMTGARVARWT